MRRFMVFAVLATALAAVACEKKDVAPAAALQKVEAPAAGLPAVATAKPGEAPAAGMGAGAVPNDPVHGGAMGGEGAMPPGHPPMGGEGGAGTMPAGHAGMGGEGMPGHGMVADASQTDGNDIPLRVAGPGSKAELDRALKAVQGDEAKAKFENAFRLTFSVDKPKRDVEKARATFEDLLRAQPNLAEAHRGLAYCALSRGFDLDGAIAAYKKALELKPEYAEVHYALAFLYAGSDLDKGREHLKKALELGMADEQGLKKVYNVQ